MPLSSSGYDLPIDLLQVGHWLNLTQADGVGLFHDIRDAIRVQARRAFTPFDFGANGDGQTDDGSAFAKIAAHFETRWQDTGATYAQGGHDYGAVLNLCGRTYVIDRPLEIEAPVSLANGRLLFTDAALSAGAGLRLGLDDPSITSGFVYGHFLHNLSIGLAETLSDDHPSALLLIPRTFATRLSNVNINAGGGERRTRYGAFVGRDRGWACTFDHGRYFGGDCALRVGQNNDHTSNKIMPTACDHGRVVNLLLCNPAGCFIKADMEHSDGRSNIAITSQTNGSPHVAHAVTIEAGYQFNMSDPVPGLGWDPEVTGILIGHDVPGTEGWDQAGVITSADSAEQIAIRGMYCVSNQMPTVVKARILSGLSIEGVKWYARGGVAVTGVDGTFEVGEIVTGALSNAQAVFRALEGGVLLFDSCLGDFQDGEPITGTESSATATTDTATAYKRDRLLELSGAGANVRIGSVRNQNTGSIAPSITSTASNPVMVDQPLSATYQPRLRGDATAGDLEYSTRGGSFSIASGVGYVTGWVNWTAINVAPVGNLEITLPGIASRLPAGFRAPVVLTTAGITHACEGLVLDGQEGAIRLYRAGTTTRITAADLAAAGNAHFSLQFLARFED